MGPNHAKTQKWPSDRFKRRTNQPAHAAVIQTPPQQAWTPGGGLGKRQKSQSGTPAPGASTSAATTATPPRPVVAAAAAAAAAPGTHGTRFEGPDDAPAQGAKYRHLLNWQARFLLSQGRCFHCFMKTSLCRRDPSKPCNWQAEPRVFTEHFGDKQPGSQPATPQHTTPRM